LANYICNTYLPNVFSPNGDGINDEFNRFSSGCPPQVYHLHIFDRWGEEVFYTNNTKQGWDGSFKGEPASLGVYAYLLVVEEYGEKKQFAGEVILVR
jgi:gliding motility-associated-like protein